VKWPDFDKRGTIPVYERIFLETAGGITYGEWIIALLARVGSLRIWIAGPYRGHFQSRQSPPVGSARQR
jgi:hypothetical protein